jgi:hypothetical protein
LGIYDDEDIACRRFLAGSHLFILILHSPLVRFDFGALVSNIWHVKEAGNSVIGFSAFLQILYAI